MNVDFFFSRANLTRSELIFEKKWSRLKILLRQDPLGPVDTRKNISKKIG